MKMFAIHLTNFINLKTELLLSVMLSKSAWLYVSLVSICHCSLECLVIAGIGNRNRDGNCRKSLSQRIAILFYLCISPHITFCHVYLVRFCVSIRIACPAGSQMLASISRSEFPSKSDFSSNTHMHKD